MAKGRIKAHREAENIDDDDGVDVRKRRRVGSVGESVENGDEEEATTKLAARKVVGRSRLPRNTSDRRSARRHDA